MQYIQNSIIAGNRRSDALPDTVIDCQGPITSIGYNLFGQDTGCEPGPTDLTIPSADIDTVLGPLADNGGPATGSGLTPLTHALPPGSPAIDAGDPAGCTYDHDGDPDTPDLPLTTDQRGYPRPADGNGDGVARCDIGAYEVQPVTYAPAWRFRGYTYQGQPRDTSNPLPGVTLRLYGRNAGEPEPGAG